MWTTKCDSCGQELHLTENVYEDDEADDVITMWVDDYSRIFCDEECASSWVDWHEWEERFEPKMDTPSLQDIYPDRFNPNGTWKTDY